MSDLLQMILLLSVSGTVMGLLLLGLRAVMKKRLPSSFYYYAWLLVLVRMALPLPGLMPAPAPQAAPTTVTAPTEPESLLSEPNQTYTAVGWRTTAAETVSEETAPVAPFAAAESQPVSRKALVIETGVVWIKSVLTAPVFWTGLWLLGAVLCLGRHVLGYRRFCAALQKTLRPATDAERKLYLLIHGVDKPALYRSTAVQTPMLLGLWKPVLVLPDRIYSPLTLENILRHELTHYRRGDIAFKWFGVAVFSLHWFNPLTGLFCRELDRACELSCDERILRHMTAGEKQNYGETLLTLAADRSLPRSVVATTFATEKRTLKERLEQIMTYKKIGKAGLVLMLVAVLLLVTCGMALGPRMTASKDTGIIEETTEPSTTSRPMTEDREEIWAEEMATFAAAYPVKENVIRTPVIMSRTPVGGEVTVSTVDELLRAIASDTTVYLEPGEYNLADATTYGDLLEGGWYTWNKVNDGYELCLLEVENFTICGSEEGEAIISAVPRYADVLFFQGGSGIAVENVTVGHTVEPGVCAGGVLYFESAEDIRVDGCRLYGCGILGVEAYNCRNIAVTDTDIYECSSGAVNVRYCWDVRVEDCEIYDCGKDYSTWRLFSAANSYGFAVVNCEIHDNAANVLLNSEYSQEVYFVGNRVADNTIAEVFCFNGGTSPVVHGCEFARNGSVNWYSGTMQAVDANGTVQEGSSFVTMTQYEADYNGPEAMEAVELEKTVNADGVTEVHVSNINELLAAIAPDTTVYLAEGDYNISKADGYGFLDGEYYDWMTITGYGNATLMITGVENFHMIGAGKDLTNLVTDPRGVDVITFRNCENITFSGITAGHTEGDSCQGGVLSLSNCEQVAISDCGLFGCGILGLELYGCQDVTVTDTDVYECSMGGIVVSGSESIAFTGCTVRDCGGFDVELENYSDNVTWDGKYITTGVYPTPAG